MSDQTDFVETFVGGRGYVQIDRYDWRNYYNDGDMATSMTLAQREAAARRYVELLKASDRMFRPKPATLADFEGYAKQALSGRDVDAAIAILQNWAATQPKVADALAVFTAEALRAHLKKHALGNKKAR